MTEEQAEGHEEGWYTDPFARHEARWMSDGTPTKLVRDEGVESYDPPPDEEPSQKPTRIEEEQVADGEDLRRAGDGDEVTAGRMAQAAEFGATWGSHIALPDLHERR